MLRGSKWMMNMRENKITNQKKPYGKNFEEKEEKKVVRLKSLFTFFNLLFFSRKLNIIIA
jgi:hypothetical protein